MRLLKTILKALAVAQVVILINIMLSAQPASAEPVLHHGVKTSQIKADNQSMAGQDRFSSRTITIGIDPSTPQYEQRAFKQAVGEWNQGGVVILVIKPYNIHDDILVDNAHFPHAKDKLFYTLGRTMPEVKDGYLTHSHIEIDPQNIKAVSVPDQNKEDVIEHEMTGVMTHEIGHAMGLPHVAKEDSCMYATHQGDVTSYDYGLLDRLYTDQKQSESQIYHLPMHDGFVIDRKSYDD